MVDTATGVKNTALLVRNQQSRTYWLDEEDATPEGYIAEQYGISLLYLGGTFLVVVNGSETMWLVIL
jgi:hypothetical protein